MEIAEWISQHAYAGIALLCYFVLQGMRDLRRELRRARSDQELRESARDGTIATVASDLRRALVRLGLAPTPPQGVPIMDVDTVRFSRRARSRSEDPSDGEDPEGA